MLLLQGLLLISLWSRKLFFLLPLHKEQIKLQTPAHSAPHRIFLLLLTGADAQAAPRQSVNVLRAMQGSSTTTIRCEMNKENVLHWYRQLPGQPPRRIAYFLRNAFFDDNQYITKFHILKHPSQPNYHLVINHLTPQDSGTYFCAYWFYESITALDRQRWATQKDTLISETQVLNSAKNSQTTLQHPPSGFSAAG